MRGIGIVQYDVEVTAGCVRLPGTLSIPTAATGAVIFAHGSGSSRLSPRNVEVSRVLNEAGLATLLFDLLTSVEAMDRANVFDIALLASRLLAADARLPECEATAGLPIGYFGASTGAAAALWAAGTADTRAAAVVSRGGRPDLAGPRLAAVTAPTLLIVGGRDLSVLELNRQAQRAMRGTVKLTIVPGATHLFEEPGALARVAELARDWFLAHLPTGRRA
jgi:putative phosphoribosyl transferase